MGIRDRLGGGNSVVGVGTAAALLVAAGIVFFWYYESQAGNRPPNPNVSFFSDDDGQTFFRDSAYKFPPMDHDGKTAYVALVFDDGQKKFVGYLVRYTPEARKQIQDAYDNPNPGESAGMAALRVIHSPDVRYRGTEMKRVGDQKWVPAAQVGIPSVNCADGTPALMVRP